MTKLTDTQLVLLSAAAAREDRAILPAADTLAVGKASLSSALNSLLKKGLIAEKPAVASAAVWREEDDQRFTLVATVAGLEAIGVELSGADAPPVPTPTPEQAKGRRTNGKADAVLTLLRRPEGASIADMSGVTNWQAHTIRAFLSGLRKKGVEITRTKDEGGKAIYRIAGVEEAAS